MQATIESPVRPRPSASHRQLLGWSVTLTALGLYGVVLFAVCLTAMTLVPFTIGIPLMLAGLGPVRSVAGYHRRWAASLLGRRTDSPYRPLPSGTSLTRTRAVLGDPATWRDLGWLIVNGVVGVTLACVSLSFFLGGVFYLICPFLWWVTPESVFGTPFGFFHIHTLSRTWLMMPVAALSFGLWAATDRALLGIVARLAEAMLGRRRPRATAPACPE